MNGNGNGNGNGKTYTAEIRMLVRADNYSDAVKRARKASKRLEKVSKDVILIDFGIGGD